MNILDSVACILLIIAFFFGYRRGLVRQLVSVLGVILALIVAYKFYDEAAPLLRGLLPLQTFASYTGYGFADGKWRIEDYAVNGLSFLLLFAVVKIALSAAGHVLHLIVAVPGLRTLNRWGGGLLSLLETAVLLLIVIYVMTIWPSDAVQTVLQNSTAAKLAVEHAPVWFGQLRELWGGTQV